MKNLIPAFKKNDALIDEIDFFLFEKEGFRLWWLGQSGYLLQWNGKRILIDPYLSDSLTKKYTETEKPHVRMSELVVQPELWKNISVVTSSHIHTDHLDAETLIPILKNNPNIKFIIPEANRAFVANRVQCDIDFPIGMNEGFKHTVDGFTFIGIPAKHNELARDENGNCGNRRWSVGSRRGCYWGARRSRCSPRLGRGGGRLAYSQSVELPRADKPRKALRGSMPSRPRLQDDRVEIADKGSVKRWNDSVLRKSKICFEPLRASSSSVRSDLIRRPGEKQE